MATAKSDGFTNVYQFRVRRYQTKLHKALVGLKYKRFIEIAHRRWGKDEIIMHAFRDISAKRPGTYWHCFPEYGQARKAIWNGINSHTGRKRIDEIFPPEIRKRVNDQDMYIETIWNSSWQMIGSDRYDATVGSGPVGIAYSEWSRCDPAAWAYHRPMLEENNGIAAFITTPQGDNHAKSMFDRALNNPNWYAELQTVDDTGIFTKEQLEETLEELRDLFGDELGTAYFEQEYYCDFSGATVGAYFGAEMRQAERDGRVCVVPVDPCYPVHTAWDLGKALNNPIWCFQVIPQFDENEVYTHSIPHIVDFYRPTDNDLEVWVKWLDERGYNGIDYVPHDIMVTEWGGGNRTRFELLRKLGRHPRRVPRVSVEDGRTAARQTIKIARFDRERCQTGIDGLKLYRRDWNAETKRYNDNPVKDWAEHIGSAFRYLGLAWRDAVPEVPAPPPKKDALEYNVDATGSIRANMGVREAVEDMIRRRNRGY